MKKDVSLLFFGIKRLGKIRRIMRLIVLLLFAGIMQISASVYSQGNKMDVKFSNITLSKLFWEVQRNTDFVFVYGTDDLEEVKKPISVDMEDVSIREFMDEVLKGTGLTYKEVENVVVIKKAEKANRKKKPATEKQAPQQEEGKKITGTVTDHDGVTLPGVNIMVKGTTIGAPTDENGNFELLVPEDKNRIVVSFIGFVTQEVEIGNKSNFRIALESDIQELDNIVVTGYQTLSRERATGAFVSVKSEDLDKQIGSTTLAEKLQGGMLPGVLIDQNNNITIRGKSSLNASTVPVIVLDGFPIETSIDNINPNDIESITVLRDAAAASIWGVRASNGVIVITTKSGKGKRIMGNAKTKNKASFDFSSTLRISQMPDLDDLRLADGATTVDYHLEQIERGYWNLNSFEHSQGQSLVLDTYRKQHQGLLSEAEANAIYNQLRSNNILNEATELFFRNSLSQQYNLSVSGASELNTFYVSVNYQSNKAYSIGNDKEVLNFMVNNKMQLLPKLRFDLIISGNYNKGTGNGISMYDLSRYHAYERILDDNGNYIPSFTRGLSSNSMTLEKAKEWEALGYHNWTYNLKQEFDNNDKTYSSFTPRVNVGLLYDIMEGLSFDSKFMFEKNDYKNESYYNMGSWYSRDWINKLTLYDNGNLIYQLPNGPTLFIANSNTNVYSFRNQLNFKRSSNDEMHQVSAILGTEVTRSIYKNYGRLYNNYDREKLTYDFIDAKGLSGGKYKLWDGRTAYYSVHNHQLKTNEVENRFFSVYSNASYTYNQKYTLSASARIDESNLFGVDVNDRITPLYSVGGSWTISKGDFFDVDKIDFLNLRITTGVNGNIDKKTSKELIASAEKDYYTQESYLDIESPENKELKWESTRTHNLGIDFSGFNNRLGATIELYQRKSFDLLGFVAADPTTGFGQVYKNTAEVENKGFDIQIDGTILKGEFRWDAGLNVSHNKNEVTKVYNPNPTVFRYLNPLPGHEILGKPIDHFYSYRWAGLSNEGEPQIYDDAGNIVSWEEPDLEYPEWLIFQGSRVPKFYGAMGNTWSYKGLTLNAIFSYKLGYMMRMPSPHHNYAYLNSDMDKRWKNPGDENNTYIPKMPTDYQVKGERSDFYQYSDYRSQSGSYIRFSTLSLTYNLPKSLIGPFLNNVQLQAQGRNLWLWTKNDENIDPETSDKYGGLSLGVTPEYTFGIRVQF
jgi:TonB-linked SusC/RagA family outer membrane protein